MLYRKITSYIKDYTEHSALNNLLKVPEEEHIF